MEMKKMKKEFLSILLSFAMFLGLMPGMSLTVLANDTPRTYHVSEIVTGKDLDFGDGITNSEEFNIAAGEIKVSVTEAYVQSDHIQCGADSIYWDLLQGMKWHAVYDSTTNTVTFTQVGLPESIYVVGINENWNPSDNCEMSVTDRIATISMNDLEAGDYRFKFCDSADWIIDYGADAEKDSDSSYKVNLNQSYTARSGGANIGFTLTKKTDVIITLDASEATPAFRIDISTRLSNCTITVENGTVIVKNGEDTVSSDDYTVTFDDLRDIIITHTGAL